MNPAPTPRLAAAEAFETAFGRPPDRFVQAPGRVNLIGEHTDYNGGFVLPCAIDRGTVVAAGLREDDRVRVVAVDMDHALDEFRVDLDITPSPLVWANYVRGAVKHLVLAHPLGLRGMDLAIAGNLPQGAGLSSSASLEVAVLQAFKSLCGLHLLAPASLARIAQAAENHFVGCACGIMDQLASARGVDGHALLIDCRSLDVRAVPVPPGMAVMILHSRVRRGLVDSEYNARRAQCQAAARQLGVTALRDAAPALLESHRAAMDPLIHRRARHVITENARTLAAADALAAGDGQALGRLMAQSHASMRDDFEITVPAIDRLVDIVQGALRDGGGCRMTGGGFGGCVVALAPHERVAAVDEAVAAHYRSPGGEAAGVGVFRASGGAGEIA